ncbi:ferroxidase fet3 [Coemansia sp. RSA 2440]|nr:ferroxidase fet3 [Coemansia sp. RSA 2440]
MAERVELFWDIGTLNISRDGYSTWKSMCVNNAVPIPPVHVTQGDVLVLNVRNSLNVPTAVHAHGIYHNYTDYYDGAEMVTECGIPPGENFTYIIDTTTQAGNFWLHSHVQSQLTDGLRTPFIVHEKIKPSTYDEEKLLYFEDWDTRSFDEESIIHSTLNVKNIPTAYRMLLINGMNGNVTQPVVFVPGKRYRVRVVSLLTVFWLKFRIPGHTMQIIDQDGVACNPVEVDGLDMGPGQRFSILVTAHDTVEYNYKYNVTLYADFFHPSPGIMPRYYSGLIEYQKNASLQTIPAVSDDQLSWSNTLDLQARDGMPLLPVDRQIVLTVKDYFPELDIPYYTFGDYAYNHTLVPTLFTALTMGDLAFNSSIYGLQSQAHVLHYGESIEVLIYSDNINDHSLHMHAGEYQVVEVGPYGDAAANNRTGVAFKRSGPAPMRCDEVTIRSYSYIKLRFRVNHGAIIFFHCHMIHNFKGLAVTFIAAPDLLQKHMKVPDEVIKMCKLQNIKTSGNAAGNAGFDLTGLPPPFLVNRE